MKMKYIEPEMSVIFFNNGVRTDDFLITSTNGGNDGDGDIGEGGFTPASFQEKWKWQIKESKSYEKQIKRHNNKFIVGTVHGCFHGSGKCFGCRFESRRRSC